jgi:chromosome partitioning protein
MKDVGVETLSMSHIAARQELRELIGELRLPGVALTF